MVKFKIKRIYDDISKDDGFRVLVDRLWPRGISKEKVRLDKWEKGLAPSPRLRKWFDHDPAKFDEFSDRYQRELSLNDEVKSFLDSIQGEETVTLLYGSKDTKVNHAVVLQKYLQKITDKA